MNNSVCLNEFSKTVKVRSNMISLEKLKCELNDFYKELCGVWKHTAHTGTIHCFVKWQFWNFCISVSLNQFPMKLQIFSQLTAANIVMNPVRFSTSN